MTKVWGIHNDRIPAAELVARGFVSIGWDEIGDLRDIGEDQVALRSQVARTYPSAKAGALPVWAGVLRRFAFEVAIGDLVVAPSKQKPVFNIGRVTGAYEYVATAAEHRHRRPVEWLVTNAPRAAFSQTARYEMGSAITLFQVANHADEFERAVDEGVPDVSDEPAGQQVRHGLLQRSVLEILRDGGIQPAHEVVHEVARRVELNEAELRQTRTGVPRYESAIHFGLPDMRAAGWLSTPSDGWAITDAGQQVLESTPERTDLANLSSAAYREAQAAKRAEKGRFKTARYPLIDSAVKLINEGHWITYSDIGMECSRKSRGWIHAASSWILRYPNSYSCGVK